MNPILACTTKAIAAITNGSKGNMSRKVAKTGDAMKELGTKMRTKSLNFATKALEKIGLRKGSIFHLKSWKDAIV